MLDALFKTLTSKLCLHSLFAVWRFESSHDLSRTFWIKFSDRISRLTKFATVSQSKQTRNLLKAKSKATTIYDAAWVTARWTSKESWVAFREDRLSFVKPGLPWRGRRHYVYAVQPWILLRLNRLSRHEYLNAYAISEPLN